MKNIIILLFGLALISVLASASEPPPRPRAGALDCPDPENETLLASELGSAGFVHNMAHHPESLRAIAQRLLEDALNGDHDQARDCAPNCTPAEPAEVVYRVIPAGFLAREDQHAVCLEFETETKDNPLRFDSRVFDTVDALNDWIMEFSQGRGKDGELLYKQCSSNCSPRYTFLIAEQRAGFEVKTEVLCGLARDKSNNRYRISTALRRRCAVN